MRPIAMILLAACAAAPIALDAADEGSSGLQPGPVQDPSPTPPPKTAGFRNALCPIDEQPIDEHIAPVEMSVAACPNHPELGGALIGTCSEEHRRLLVMHPERYEEQVWKVCHAAEIAREKASQSPAKDGR
jgi:hypothetical protein